MAKACRKCFSFKLDSNGKCPKCKNSRYVVTIDEGIAQEVKDLWKVGVFTDNSCEGHVDSDRFYAYLMFSSNYPFREWLKTLKEEYEKEFYPLCVDLYEYGLSQFSLIEHRNGDFSLKKREKCHEIFRQSLRKLAGDYAKERKRLLGD